MAGQPPASMPDTPSQVWYRLGSGFTTDDTDVWWNRIEDTGLLSMAEEPAGWEAVDYNVQLDQVGSRDGALIGPTSIGPKQLAIKAAVVSPSPLLLRQRIARVRQLLRGVVVWEQFDFGVGERLAMLCRAEGAFRPSPPFGHQLGGIASQLTFDLVSGRPLKYSTGAAQQLPLGLPTGVTSGRTYSKTYSFNYGGVVNPGGAGIAVNRGDEWAAPLFTILGPVPQAVIRNDTTGAEFSLGAAVAAGQTVTISADTGIVVPASTRIVGTPFLLAPGPNVIRWRTAVGTTSADAQLTLTWRSTWQ